MSKMESRRHPKSTQINNMGSIIGLASWKVCVQTEFRISVVFAFPCVVCAHVGILLCVRMLVRFFSSIVHFLTLSD